MLFMEHCNICSGDGLFGQRRAENLCLERWIWRKLLGIRWQDRVSNENLPDKTGQNKWKLLPTIKDHEQSWLRKAIGQDVLLQLILEGKMDEKRPRGGPRLEILNEMCICQSLKSGALQ